MNGIMCSSSVYRFEEVTFEFHHFCGPWPLRKDGELKKFAEKKFFELYDRFAKLSAAEKEACCIEKGGCALI